jgi:hypothetical protein
MSQLEWVRSSLIRSGRALCSRLLDLDHGAIDVSFEREGGGGAPLRCILGKVLLH